MSDPDEVYELPVEDMYEVPGSRLRELADKAAFLEAALAEEREKNERLRGVERAARTVVSLWEQAEELVDEGGGDLLHDATNTLRDALSHVKEGEDV